MSLRFRAHGLESDQGYRNSDHFGLLLSQFHMPVGTMTIGAIVRAGRLSLTDANEFLPQAGGADGGAVGV
jgi:hypothetical protein